MTYLRQDEDQRIYSRWKAHSHFPGVSYASSALLVRFLKDLEIGLNTGQGSKKGPRSYTRLNTLRIRCGLLTRRLEERYGIQDITQVTEEQIHAFFSEMQQGVIRKTTGEQYKAVDDYVKDFKTFWHWYMTIARKEDIHVPDITAYLSIRKEKPRWVYLTEDQVKRLCSMAKFEYRVLMMFLLDTGVRSPSELLKVRVCDLSKDFRNLHIRDEGSKTFGRRINLLLCSDVLRDYVHSKRLQRQDVVFPISAPVVNRYLKRLAKRVLGDGESPGGELYCNLTMYDFRHVSACFWLPRYKSESALKYRFGWRKTERIHYYTEFLGMSDTISQDDVLLTEDKVELEKRLKQAERDKEIMQERIVAMEREMEKVLRVADRLVKKVG